MKRLLDRQLRLVEYMTSAAAIFGDKGAPSSAHAPPGIERELLDVEARFSYAKRMEKITAILPRTFELLGPGEGQIVRDFVAACPPANISRLDNARQFHRFLCSRWLHAEPEPGYLPDVAACELAFAEVDADVEDKSARLDHDQHDAPRGAIRRNTAVVLVRCGYDVRSIFEAGAGQAVPSKRDTPLVVALPPGADHPQVFEVPPAVFDLLAELDDWTLPPELNGAPELARLLADLAEHGLVEVRQ
jgi:hypothetical protein